MTLHSLRAAGTLWFAALYFGLVLLGYVAWMEGASMAVAAGAAAGLVGAGLGALWARTANGAVVMTLERGETPARTWKDPTPAFGYLAGTISVFVLGWSIAAYINRPFLSTWTWMVPGPLLLSGGMPCTNELLTSLSLRAFQRRTGRRVEVSLGKNGAFVYRTVPIAHKVHRE